MLLRSAAVVVAVELLVACGGTTTAPPEEPAAGTTQCPGSPPGPGYECVQNCGPPVASDSDPPPGYSWLSAEDAENRRRYGCPICLPADARIATPSGAVAISTVAAGDSVWSLSDAGERVVATVLYVGSTQAPPNHRIVEIELADGRVLRASPGHPSRDGRPVGALAVGESLDGSVVVSVRKLPYRGRTYDLVLDQRRQHYLSDGVLVRSSLDRSQVMP